MLTKPLRRIPTFHPVPLRSRRDWGMDGRQAAFIGYLAQESSVMRAAALVGKTREAAYRLRRKPGVEEFAAVWDMVTGRNMVDLKQVTRAARKVTPGLLWEHAQSGTVRPPMFCDRLVPLTRKADNCALLQHLNQLNRTIENAAMGEY